MLPEKNAQKPTNPRIEPSTRPEKISFRMTYHQSLNLISPSAIARIIMEEAWDPEFPPLEMINGINKASTTA